MSTLVRALHNRRFALLWSGQTLSVLGDRMFQVALAWWILQETGSALAMGTLYIVSVIPMLIFLLIGGALVDRFSRFWLMLLSDGVRGVLILVVAALAAADTLTMLHVYMMSFVLGFVESFFQPAYRAALYEVTGADDLTSAYALTGLSGQFAGIAGPAAGAALVVVGGTPLAFALDGLSFLISAVCLVPLLASPRPAAPTTDDSSAARPGAFTMFADIRAGLAFVAGNPWLWVAILISSVSNIFYAGPMEVALPFLLNGRDAGVGALGAVYSAMAAGAVVASVWIGRQTTLRRRGLLLYGAWLMIGVLVAAMGVIVPVWGSVVVGFGIGFMTSALGMIWAHTLPTVVPDAFMGRVSSVDSLGSFILLPLGYGVGGIAAERFGAPAVFVVGGLLHAGLVALGLLHPRVRRFD